MRNDQRAAENTEASRDRVLHVDAPADAISCLLLLRNQLQGDIFEILDRRLLRNAEGDLVGELIQRALRLGTLAVGAADDQSQLAEIAADAADDLAPLERRQMEHHRRPHTCSEVGRALRQITQPLVKSEFQPLVKQGIELVGGIVGCLQRKPLLNHLQADMILFVEHDAQALILAEQERPALAAADELWADKAFLDQRHALLRFELAHADKPKISRDGAVAIKKRVAHALDHLFSALCAQSARKRIVLEVPRKTDPC